MNTILYKEKRLYSSATIKMFVCFIQFFGILLFFCFFFVLRFLISVVLYLICFLCMSLKIKAYFFWCSSLFKRKKIWIEQAFKRTRSTFMHQRLAFLLLLLCSCSFIFYELSFTSVNVFRLSRFVFFYHIFYFCCC